MPTKLSKKDVIKIRKMCDVYCHQYVAEFFNISKSTVSKINRGVCAKNTLK